MSSPKLRLPQNSSDIMIPIQKPFLLTNVKIGHMTLLIGLENISIKVLRNNMDVIL